MWKINIISEVYGKRDGVWRRAAGGARRPVRGVRASGHLSLSLETIALSLRPSAARSSSSCKVKVTSDVLCYNRWGALWQVQCLVESGRDTTRDHRARSSRGLCDRLWYTNSEKFMNCVLKFVWTIISRDANISTILPIALIRYVLNIIRIFSSQTRLLRYFKNVVENIFPVGVLDIWVESGDPVQ